MSRTYTLRQAASKLDVSTDTIKNLIGTELEEGDRAGNRVTVLADGVDRMRAEKLRRLDAVDVATAEANIHEYKIALESMRAAAQALHEAGLAHLDALRPFTHTSLPND